MPLGRENFQRVDSPMIFEVTASTTRISKFIACLSSYSRTDSNESSSWTPQRESCRCRLSTKKVGVQQRGANHNGQEASPHMYLLHASSAPHNRGSELQMTPSDRGMRYIHSCRQLAANCFLSCLSPVGIRSSCIEGFFHSPSYCSLASEPRGPL